MDNVTVIGTDSEIGEPSSISDRYCCVHFAWKRHESLFHSCALNSKSNGDHLLSVATTLGEGDSKIKNQPEEGWPPSDYVSLDTSIADTAAVLVLSLLES